MSLLPKGPFVSSLSGLLLAFALTQGAGAQLTRATAVPNLLSQPVDNTRLVSLRGTVHPLARAANDQGLIPGSTRLDRVQIILKHSDVQEAALRQLISDQHTPGSPGYHAWLTPDQFGKQFGPSDSDIEKLEEWLRSQGFSDIKVNPGRQTLEIAGSAGQFQQSFHTEIHRYLADGQTHFANAAEPKIPEALAPIFGGFASLNNFPIHLHSRVLGKAAYNMHTKQAKPQWTTSADYGASFVMSPGDFATQYNLNPLYGAGTDGTGQTIAIINESNIDTSIVDSFRTLFGLPANTPQIVVDGNDPGIDGINNPDGPNGASGEAYLDVEWAGAVAPKAKIDLVIAGDTTLSSGLLLAAGHAIYGNIAPVVSVSFGACEADLGSANEYLSALWEQAAAQGITVAVSTGDAGSAGCDNPDAQEYAMNGLAVSGFATTPYNVAVGGTDFFYSAFNQGTAAVNAQLNTYWNTTPTNSTPTVSIKGVIPEQGWNNSQYGSNILMVTGGTTIAAGSGGPSTLGLGNGPYPKPRWQTGAGVPADGARDIPDVSLFASSGANASFYPVCGGDGDCQPVAGGGTVQIEGIGGTSASTPAFAAMMALVNQKYGRQGQANFVLYPMAAQYPAVFHDVTHGTNSVPCAIGSKDCISVANPVYVNGTAEGEIGKNGVAEYNATAGYDLATGLGSVDANALVANWNKVTFAASSTTLVPSSTTVTHGQNVTFQGAVSGSGTPTGSVALMADSTEPLQGGQTLFELANGSFSGSYNALPGGTYNVWGQYSGDGVNAASKSTPVKLTVAPEASTVHFSILDVASQGANTVAPGSSVMYGKQLVLTAEPGPSSGAASYGIPTGNVTFLDGSTSLATSQINAGGEAAYNAPLAVGAHTLSAKYNGDNSYSAATSTATSFTVVKDTPGISFSSPAQTGPVSYQGGGPIVFTVQVENNANKQSEQINGVAFYTPAAPPTGTVTVTGFPADVSSSVPLQSALDLGYLFPEGVGTLTANALPTGSYHITVSYPGDANYNAISASYTIAVVGSNLLPSVTTATATSPTTSSKAAVTVLANVSGQSGKAAPTGTVIFAVSGYEIASVNLTAGSGSTASGTATFSSAALLPGTNVLTVQYSGDAAYQPSSTTVSITNGSGPGMPGFALAATPVNITSPGASTASTVTVAPSNGFTGNVALTCSVTPPTGVTDVPTCAAASIAVNGTLAATGTLTINSDAVLPAGTYTMTVTGTAGSATASTSIPVVVTVPVVAGFTLSAPGVVIATAGMNGTSTVTVAPNNGFTGTIALQCAVASSTLSHPPTCTVTAPPAISGAGSVSAILTVTSSSDTAAGSYSVNVTGTAGALSQTISVPVTVNGPVATPNFALSGVAITNLAAGSSATSTITVTPSGGFTGAVALACSTTSSPAGAVNAPTCTVTSPPSITGTGAVSATLTVNTTARTSSMLRDTRSQEMELAGGAALALLLLAFPTRRRHLRVVLSLAGFALLATAMTGCGGSSSTAKSPGNPGTTSGTYMITVTGTSGSITQSTQVSVSVN